MNLQQLEIQNPWWKGDIEQDFHLQKLAQQKYQYHPTIIPLSELTTEAAGIYTLVGPRQIGKTTYLKTLIRELLKHTPSTSVFYFSCENLSKEQLREILSLYLDKIGTGNKQYIFLDEISLIEGWEFIELELYNKGFLRNTIIINSGSSSLNLKKSAERLPGRKNKGKLYYFFPLSFREFVFLADPRAEQIAQKPYAFLNLLQTRFLEYIQASGFPPIINYFYSGRIEDLYYDIYKDWIEGEITKANRSVFSAYQIFSRLLESMSSQVNWESIAKSTTIKSHTTVADYIDLLDSLFITKVIPQIGGNMKVSFVKNKKIFFYDHFLFSVIEKNILKILNYHDYFAQKIKTDDVYLSKIVENIVFSNILKHLASKGYSIHNTLFYWRSKTQKEVDFVVRVRKGTKKITIPIEVKYRNKIERNTIKTFKPYILSKNAFQEDDLIYPVALFLFMIEDFVKI